MNASATAPAILAIGGTTRAGSTSERALLHAAGQARKLGAAVTVLCGQDLMFPILDPAAACDDPRVERFLRAVRASDGLIISSAAYHGGVSGMLKNAIDYIDSDSPADPYLSNRAVGCIACAGGWQATVTTMSSLRSIVHALRGWPVPLGVTINSSEKVFGPDGSCQDERVADSLDQLAREVVAFASVRRRLAAVSRGAAAA